MHARSNGGLRAALLRELEEGHVKLRHTQTTDKSNAAAKEAAEAEAAMLKVQHSALLAELHTYAAGGAKLNRRRIADMKQKRAAPEVLYPLKKTPQHEQEEVESTSPPNEEAHAPCPQEHILLPQAVLNDIKTSAYHLRHTETNDKSHVLPDLECGAVNQLVADLMRELQTHRVMLRHTETVDKSHVLPEDTHVEHRIPLRAAAQRVLQDVVAKSYHLRHVQTRDASHTLPDPQYMHEWSDMATARQKLLRDIRCKLYHLQKVPPSLRHDKSTPCTRGVRCPLVFAPTPPRKHREGNRRCLMQLTSSSSPLFLLRHIPQHLRRDRSAPHIPRALRSMLWTPATKRAAVQAVLQELRLFSPSSLHSVRTPPPHPLPRVPLALCTLKGRRSAFAPVLAALLRAPPVLRPRNPPQHVLHELHAWFACGRRLRTVRRTLRRCVPDAADVFAERRVMAQVLRELQAFDRRTLRAVTPRGALPLPAPSRLALPAAVMSRIARGDFPLRTTTVTHDASHTLPDPRYTRLACHARKRLLAEVVAQRYRLRCVPPPRAPRLPDEYGTGLERLCRAAVLDELLHTVPRDAPRAPGARTGIPALPDLAYTAGYAAAKRAFVAALAWAKQTLRRVSPPRAAVLPDWEEAKADGARHRVLQELQDSMVVPLLPPWYLPSPGVLPDLSLDAVAREANSAFVQQLQRAKGCLRPVAPPPATLPDLRYDHKASAAKRGFLAELVAAVGRLRQVGVPTGVGRLPDFHYVTDYAAMRREVVAELKQAAVVLRHVRTHDTSSRLPELPGQLHVTAYGGARLLVAELRTYPGSTAYAPPCVPATPLPDSSTARHAASWHRAFVAALADARLHLRKTIVREQYGYPDPEYEAAGCRAHEAFLGALCRARRHLRHVPPAVVVAGDKSRSMPDPQYMCTEKCAMRTVLQDIREQNYTLKRVVPY